MTDIVVYTIPETLAHKRGGDGGQIYYWHLSKPPIRFKKGDRIFFAVKKHVVGSFECEEFHSYGNETIVWNKVTWIGINPRPTDPFRGFRYRWW